MALEFISPSESGNKRARHDWKSVAAELRDNPGEWAVMPATSNIYAMMIKRGTLADFRPAGHFEARAIDQNTSPRVIARYVGDASNP